MKKRILSLLLAAVMLIGLLPTVALADAEPAPQSDVKYGSYENGVWTENDNGSSASTSDGNITVKKEAVSKDNNTYEITLTVEMKQTASTVAAPAATVLVIDLSNSMTWCEACGNEDNHKKDCKYSGKVKDAQTRLYAAKNAAKAFLSTYAGTDASATRRLAIVGYGETSKTFFSWKNVAGGAGQNSYNAAVSAIDRLQPGFVIGDATWRKDYGATNLQAGVQLAANLTAMSTVSAIKAKNVIVLTDGVPTMRLTSSANKTSTEYLGCHHDMGLWGLGSHWTTDGDVDGDGKNGSKNNNDNAKNAANNAKAKAALYTVCFGAENSKCYDGGPTVGNFLRNDIATAAQNNKQYAYNAKDANELNKAFKDITQTIMDGIVAGTVTDSLPTAVSTTDPNFAGSWELKPENATSVVENTDGSKTYIYTKTYTVTIDPEKVAEGTGYQPLNGETYLSYGENGKINFPIPAGKVTYPEITYTLIYNANGNANGDDVTGMPTSPVTEKNTKDSHDFTVSSTEPTREGYTFTGWNTAADGTGTTYAKNSTVTATKQNPTVNLYAQWTKNPTTATVTITKTFTGEGFQQTMVPEGFGLTLNKVEGEGENVTKTEQTLMRGEGYTWTATLGAGNYEITENNADVDGWTRTTTGLTFEVTNTDITNGNKTVTVVNTYEKDKTVSAAKKEVQCAALVTDEDATAKFDGEFIYPTQAKNEDGTPKTENGKPVFEPILANVGDSVTLLYKITVTGDPGASFKVTDANTTLYHPTDKVSQSGNDYTGTLPTTGAGTDGKVSFEFFVYKTFSITKNTTTLTNSITVDGVRPDNPPAVPVGDKNTFKLTYHANAGSDTVTGMPTPNPVEYGPTSEKKHGFIITDAVPARDGYTFDGWCNTPSGTDRFTTGYNYTIELANGVHHGETDMYAQWKLKPTTAKVTINKEFYGEVDYPVGSIKIKLSNGDTEYTLTQSGTSYTFTPTAIELPVGEYTITEEGQNVEGYNCTTSGLTFEVTQADIGEGTKTITITNTYTNYGPATFDLNKDITITKTLTGDGAEDLTVTERTFYVDVYPSDKDMNYDATKDPVATGTVEWTKNGENKFTFDKTLPFDHADTYYFVLKEQKSGVVGMHYDDGAYGFGYFLTIVVTANDAKTGYEATGTLTCAGKKADTITNEYTKPTKETLTTDDIYLLKRASVAEKYLYDWLDDAAQDKKSVLMFPETDGKLTVDKSVDKIALAYRVTVKGDTGAVATVKDDSAIYVPIARSYTGEYDVAVNEDDSITVTFHKWNMVYLYFIKIVERGANGEFPSPVNNTAIVNDKEIPSGNTYINDKTPGGFDFSDIILKDLYVTGDQNFPSSLTFRAKLTFNERKPLADMMSLPTEEETGDDVVDVWTFKDTILTATFTPDDVKFDEKNANVKPFLSDGSHLFLTFPAEGIYKFTLEELNDGVDGVKYDGTVYTIYVTVVPDGETGLKVESVGYETVNGDIVHSEALYYDYEGHGIVGHITFYNEVDTGDIPYYPIIPILPTVKDEGKLNKTDHFAYIIGYPDGTVHPNGEITRAEVATIFFRLLKDDVRNAYFTSYNTYSDVKLGKWYNNPISTMSALGIINGYPDGTFRPDAPITRAEFAAIAARFDETATRGTTTFVDVYGHWAADEIAKAYGNDWIKGYPDGTFRPDRNITRAEAMTLINRVLDRAPESPADLLPDMNKWSDNMDTTKWYYLAIQEATNSHDYTRKTFDYEMWKRMLLDPDWSRYER